MSRKRITSGGDTLTGGSGDVNPQFFRTNITMAVNDTPNFNSFTLGPVGWSMASVRGQDKGYVVEFLKIGWDGAFSVAVAAGVNYILDYVLFSGTAPNGMDNQTRITAAKTAFNVVHHSQRVINCYTVSGTQLWTDPNWFDLTDGAGHGPVFPAGNFQLAITNSQGSSTNSKQGVMVTILYRIKEVPLVEYIGMLSQFASTTNA